MAYGKTVWFVVCRNISNMTLENQLQRQGLTGAMYQSQILEVKHAAPTFRVLGLSRASSCQVKVSLVVFTQQDDATQAVRSKNPCHPAWSHRRLGFVMFAQACEHSIIVHLVLFLRVFLVLFHLKHNSSSNI